MAGLQSLVAEDTLWHLPGRDAVFEMFGRARAGGLFQRCRWPVRRAALDSQGRSAKASLERPHLTNGQILQRELRTRGLMLDESSSTIVNVCGRSFGLSACG
jgi:hypothetical protein